MPKSGIESLYPTLRLDIHAEEWNGKPQSDSSRRFPCRRVEWKASIRLFEVISMLKSGMEGFYPTLVVVSESKSRIDEIYWTGTLQY